MYHVFLALTITELSTLKQVRFFWPTLHVPYLYSLRHFTGFWFHPLIFSFEYEFVYNLA